MKLHIFSYGIIIWNLSIFRRELQLEVEHMYTIYWTVVTWRRDRGVTWHIRWAPLILLTTLLNLWTFRLVKVKIKHFWFVTWPLDWCITRLFAWGPFILSHHPTKFVIHKSSESGDITSLICHATTWSMWTWLCSWSSLILILAKFGIHKSISLVKVEIKLFWFVRDPVVAISRDFPVGFLHPKSPPCQVWGP